MCVLVCRVGDVLESINGVNLTNADHRDAVKAVKETKRPLSIVSTLYSIVVSILDSIVIHAMLTSLDPASPEKCSPHSDGHCVSR